jgi:lipoic acid synthetase
VVLAARPEVFSHNVEMVPRLYRRARPGSRYERSLALLADAARRRDAGEYRGRTKTGIMLGLGESAEEVRETMRDIRAAGVEVLTLGQYLQPTSKHLPVERYVHPDEFADHRAYALSLGFSHCESGPLVRSSYHAHEHVGAPLRAL